VGAHYRAQFKINALHSCIIMKEQYQNMHRLQVPTTIVTRYGILRGRVRCSHVLHT
jgi:hypothetical protein